MAKVCAAFGVWAAAKDAAASAANSAQINFNAENIFFILISYDESLDHRHTFNLRQPTKKFREFAGHRADFAIADLPAIHARQHKPEVDVIGHLVRGERAFDFPDDFFVRRNLRERERERAMAQAVEMFDEFENFSTIQAQAFPNRIAALHGGIEGADASLITVQKFSVDVDDQVAVFFVEGLKHGDAMMTAKNNCG